MPSGQAAGRGGYERQHCGARQVTFPAEFPPRIPVRTSHCLPSSLVLVSLYIDLGAKSIHGVYWNETSVVYSCSEVRCLKDCSHLKRGSGDAWPLIASFSWRSRECGPPNPTFSLNHITKLAVSERLAQWIWGQPSRSVA